MVLQFNAIKIFFISINFIIIPIAIFIFRRRAKILALVLPFLGVAIIALGKTDAWWAYAYYVKHFYAVLHLNFMGWAYLTLGFIFGGIAIFKNRGECRVNKPVKRIIAREGLIFMGICIFWIIFILVTMMITQNFRFIKEDVGITILIILSCYGAYLLIRFIIWAIKTLKEK